MGEFFESARGLNFTLYYSGANVLILIVIIILAARRSTAETKLEKQNRQRNKHKTFSSPSPSTIYTDEDEEEKNEFYDNEIVNKQQSQIEYMAHNTRELRVIQHRITDTTQINEFGSMPSTLPSLLKSKTYSSPMNKLQALSFCCWQFYEDSMARWYIYAAFLMHIWDSGSDLGVIYTFFQSSQFSINILGFCSIAVLLNYRIFSALSFRAAQRGWRDTFLQLLDVQLFVDVYRSSIEIRPSNSLLWIRAMEAVLESAPQVILQFVFLYNETEFLVWASLIGSVASLTFSILNYSDLIFEYDGILYMVTYGIRFCFRLCEVLGRCMILALIWGTFNNLGAIFVLAILISEFIFYSSLTQMRIPIWEIVSFLIIDIDLNLTFDGREGALTKPLHKNYLYRLIFKPVSEMFTNINENTQIIQNNHTLASLSSPIKLQNKKKLIIAPAHYIFRFLESVFELFFVIIIAIFDEEIYHKVFLAEWWIITVASICTVCTPVLYFIVRSFANESKTLEKNLIALVLQNEAADIHEVIRLIGSGASLEQTDYHSNTIVHACIKNDNFLLLQRLFRVDKNKVPINHSNKYGFTPLLLCAKEGSLQCFKLFVDNRYKYTCIHLNACHPHTQQYLVHIAAQFNHPNIIKFLAKFDLKETQKYKQRLDAKEINPNMIVNKSGSHVHCMYTYVYDKQVNKEPISGWNACHVCCRFNAKEALEMCIKVGINYTDRLSNGDTCGILAASRGYTVILDVLHDAGYNFNERGNCGYTAIYAAAVHNHPFTIKVLKGFGGKIEIPDMKGNSISFACLKRSNFSCLSVLAEIGCVFDGKECVKYLNKVNDDFLTPLMWACRANSYKLVKLLLDSGADIDKINKFHETAVHFAAGAGALECMQILERYGARMYEMNGIGNTPLDHAIKFDHPNVVEFYGVLKGEKQKK